MIIQELITKLGFEADEKPLAKVEQAIDRIRVRLELLAGFEITKKFVQMAEKFAEWGQQLQVTAENVGVSVEALQELEFAAERSGVAGEEMAHSMAILSRHLYEAKTGSMEAQLAFSKIGISGEQVAGFKSSQDALYAVANALHSIQDPIRRMGASQEVLGRGGFKLVSFLAQGSPAIRAMGDEMRKLGLVLSGPQVQALTETEHSFQKFFHILQVIGAQIASNFGPVFTLLIDKFGEWYRPTRS